MNPDTHKSLIKQFEPNQILSDPEALVVYDLDASHSSGTPDAVLYPSSAEEVAKAVRWAKQNEVPIIARGAGTGLSGGAVAEEGGLLVHFTRMQRILELDATGRSALVEPGIVNQYLADTVLAQGLQYPPDPASGRSATLGGNVAENAGGPHCFKYGVTTNYISAIEFVDAEGRLVQVGGSALDYPEYNLTSLLTGSEGTLGIITKIGVRLLRQPPAVKTMMVAFDLVKQAGEAVSAMIAAGLVPAAMEMMDQKIARIVEDYAHPGIPTDAAAILIIEVDGYQASLDEQIDEIVNIVPKYGGRDMRIAGDEKERQQVWFARKSAIGALARLAPAYLLLDGTVPRSNLAEALQATDRICDNHELQVGYVFHAGDGNLHPLILMYPDDREQVARVHKAGGEFMHEVVRMGGSITGEHGVGIEKREYLPLMYSPEELEVMKDIKHAFDPGDLFNPGKIFPASPGGNDHEDDGSQQDAPGAGAFQPTSVSEAAAGFAALTRQGEKVRISGAVGTRPEGRVCSTQSLDTILEYAPDDLNIAVGAGATLKDIQDYVAKDGLRLALAAPWEDATLGGLIAENVNAPLRMRYGSIADQILAMTIVLADGRSIRAGRPVVKNVAGYDLPKLMVGSYGSLGLIADVTLKLHVQPHARRTLLVPLDDLQHGVTLGLKCLSKAYVASGIVIGKGIELPGLPESEYCLAYTAEGLGADVEAELALVSETLKAGGAADIHESGSLTCGDLWAAVLGHPEGDFKLRAGLPVKHLAEYASTQEATLPEGPMLWDVANGLIYAATSAGELESARDVLGRLRSAALALDGYAIVLQAPGAWRDKLDPWGYTPDALAIMKALKSYWDPAGILPRAFLTTSG